jgi:transposase-like protein
MKRRKWTPEQKVRLVLEGLRGRAVAEICTEFGISQNQYYKWRDQFLSNAHKAFIAEQMSKRSVRIEKENLQLKRLIGELALELKKNGDDYE